MGTSWSRSTLTYEETFEYDYTADIEGYTYSVEFDAPWTLTYSGYEFYESYGPYTATGNVNHAHEDEGEEEKKIPAPVEVKTPEAGSSPLTKEAWRKMLEDRKQLLSVVRPVDMGIHRTPRNHIFPKELREFFSLRGFKGIDYYTIPLDRATHDAIHKWMGSGSWNEVIKSRILIEEARLGR